MTDATDREGRQPAGLFREEALRRYFERQEHGDVLRLAPAWTRWSFLLLVLLVVAGAGFVSFARVTEYASGPAVVVAPGSTANETPPTPPAGTQPGIDETGGRAALPADGPPAVVAFVPSRYLRRLQPGMPIFVRFDGEAGPPRRLRVDSIEVRALSPDEAARRLGAGLASGLGSLRPTEPMLAVRASLAGAADVRTSPSTPPASIYPSLTGTADIAIGSERLLFVLVPALSPAAGDER